MNRATAGTVSGPPLVEQFARLYGREPDVVAQAPGRIEFIGNHTDYNGGLVLGAAIVQRVEVALALAAHGGWRFASGRASDPIEIEAGAIARQTGAATWVNYPLGVLHGLQTFNRTLPGAFDYLVVADLPSGAGLSSSAAIELASALAFLAVTGQELPRERLVELAWFAENEFVGVPCGILDQGVSGFGRKDHLVLIDCAGPEFQTLPLPGPAQFWLFNTHTKHALVDGLYATRHRECMAAARELHVDSLRHATPAMVAAAKLPPELARRARHVTEEIERVRETVAALRSGDLPAVGRLLVASHRSSQTLFENSTPELDFLVEQLTAQPEVFGARLTGGGFGGAVMAFTSPAFSAVQAQAVASAYHERFGVEPEAFATSTGDGASVLRQPTF